MVIIERERMPHPALRRAGSALAGRVEEILKLVLRAPDHESAMTKKGIMARRAEAYELLSYARSVSGEAAEYYEELAGRRLAFKVRVKEMERNLLGKYYPGTGVYVLHPNLASLPLTNRDYVIGHELGHLARDAFDVGCNRLPRVNRLVNFMASATEEGAAIFLGLAFVTRGNRNRVETIIYNIKDLYGEDFTDIARSTLRAFKEEIEHDLNGVKNWASNDYFLKLIDGNPDYRRLKYVVGSVLVSLLLYYGYGNDVDATATALLTRTRRELHGELYESLRAELRKQA